MAVPDNLRPAAAVKGWNWMASLRCLHSIGGAASRSAIVRETGRETFRMGSWAQANNPRRWMAVSKSFSAVGRDSAMLADRLGALGHWGIGVGPLFALVRGLAEFGGRGGRARGRLRNFRSRQRRGDLCISRQEL